MGFKCKYPRGYFGTVAVLEKWFNQRCSMTKKERDELASSFGKGRKVPKRFVDRKTVECSKVHFLVDYSSLSSVTLDTKKNRYLQNEKGYFVCGLLCAKNVVENRKYALFVPRVTQITKKSIQKLKLLLENELGYKVKFVTDNQHELTDIADKKVTMWIEVEFGGLKTKLYKKLKPLQYSKNNRIYTKLDFEQFAEMYLERLMTCGFKLLNPRDLEDYVKKTKTENFKRNA